MKVYALTTLLLAGCTSIVGNHNTVERHGPCDVTLLGACESAGTSTSSTKDKTSHEGDRPRVIDLRREPTLSTGDTVIKTEGDTPQ
jgi:hypothetical protein